MKKLKLLCLMSVLVAVGMLSACGDDNAFIRYLMGGSIQGFPAKLDGVVTTFAGDATAAAGSTDATGTAARFSIPAGITTDGRNLYVCDYDNHTIRKIVITTGVVTTLAGTAGVVGHDDATGPAASFNEPFGITTDGTNLYVADSQNNTIRKIVIATGVVTTLAGTHGVTGHADGTGPAASFNRPVGVTTDRTNLYVSDQDNYTIRKIEIATGVVTTLAGTHGVFGHVDATGPAASFLFPTGITTDGAHLYVADHGHTVRKIVIASGDVSTLAGTAGVIGHDDGIGAAASFNLPYGITTDGTNLYVSEINNETIRKIVIATGVVTTLAGTHGVVGHADGTGPAASFHSPDGLTTDGRSLYVTDELNDTIRKIQ